MDRHPQQLKRERQDKKRRARNKRESFYAAYFYKKVLSTTSKKDAEPVYRNTVRIIDKAVSKNLIHRNTGSRRKAQITRHLNSLS